MKNITYLSVLIFCLILSCSKGDDSNTDPNAAFSDINDANTTAVETTIPRVEISQNGNLLSLLLSVTNQDGIPLQNFTLGNYQIEILTSSTSEIVDINGITLTELNELSNTNPIAAATTLDYSNSMYNKDITDMETAIMNFINLKKPNDLMSILKFSSKVYIAQDFTNDKNLLLNAVENVDIPRGSTAFYDACYIGLEETDKLDDVLPVVIGFTDGLNNNSVVSLERLITKSKTLNTPIYTVGFGGAAINNMQYLADETGGRFYYAPTGEEITELYQIIDGQLRNLYILDWVINYASGTEITIKITTEYTSANGSFTDVSYKTIVIQ